MRQHIIKVLRPFDAISVENSAYPGTPDIWFIEGGIELKWIREWPLKTETPVRIDHFTQQQRVWLKRRWHYGGNVWLLLCAQGDWLLFDGETAARHVGLVTKADLYRYAHSAWGHPGLDEEQLRRILGCGRKANNQ